MINPMQLVQGNANLETDAVVAGGGRPGRIAEQPTGVNAPGANSMRLRGAVLLSAFVLLALSQVARAVSPAPDGGYDSFNTAEGELALHELLPGPANTALGASALYSTTTGSVNTATGSAALFENTTGSKNTANGQDALKSNTTGSNNTATGHVALGNENTSGSANTATGRWALLFNSTSNNTATGWSALQGSTTGTSNTADGANALYEDAIFEDHTGSRNVAIGSSALYSNSSGGDNTATGVNALYFNKANYNTATGYQALESNTTGSNNTAHGLNALNANTSGSYNTANGASALFSNTIGTDNTAEGELALYQNTTGSTDTALGQAALTNNTTGFQNTALGALAALNLNTGSNNIAVGFEAGINLTTGNNNIEIGNPGVAGESGAIRIGTAGTQTTTFIAGITGVPISGTLVTVGSTGQLGIRTSSARFKERIEPMEKASEVLYALKPVTFRYKKELDPEGTPQFGLVAEEVAKVNPDLVTCDEKGRLYTVRYEAVNAMLLNEFLKKHRQGEKQKSKIERLQATVAQLESLLRERAAEIQAITEELASTSAR